MADYVYGRVPVAQLVEERRIAFQTEAGVDVAPAGAIVISKEAITLAAAAIAGFIAGQQQNLSAITDKLNLVIAKLDEVLADLKQLRYDIDEITKENIARFVKSNIQANIALIHKTFELSEGEQRLLYEHEKETIRTLTFDLVKTIVVLIDYRGRDGYGHWTAVGAGTLAAALGGRASDYPPGQLRGYLSLPLDWLKEAVSEGAEKSFPVVVKTFSERVREIEQGLPNGVVEYLTLAQDQGEYRPNPTNIRWRYNICTISGNMDDGYVGSLRSEYHHHPPPPPPPKFPEIDYSRVHHADIHGMILQILNSKVEERSQLLEAIRGIGDVIQAIENIDVSTAGIVSGL